MPTRTLDLSNYHLSFSDEFSAPSLDTGTWDTRYWWGGRYLASNNEKQYFADGSTALVRAHAGSNPFSVANGVLGITARPSPDRALSDGQPYVSGLITSHASFAQTYGYFEIRADVPEGRGLWPAFWLLPQSGAWPPEIDVLELLGHDTDTYFVSTHWTGSVGHVFDTDWIDSGVDLSAGFHRYGVDWRPDSIAFYLDGIEVARQPGFPDDMAQPMYLLAGLMVGGVWPGDPDASTRFPADFLIDYIRAYALDEAAFAFPDSDARESAVATRSFVGGRRADRLAGTDGHDHIDGRQSGDTMTGGGGDDTYVVDRSSDRVIETALGGVDTVRTSLTSYRAPAEVENVVLLTRSRATLTGNALDNVLRGGDGNDTIDGGAGEDFLYGGGGADIFVLRPGQASGDVVHDFGAGDRLRLDGFGPGASFVNVADDVWGIGYAGGVDHVRIVGAGSTIDGAQFYFI